MSETVVITGGRGRLASAIATLFQSLGHRTLAPGRGDLNVADPNSVRQWFARTETIDLLVNAAGTLRDAPAIRSDDHLDTSLDTNLRGAFLCSRAAAARMLRRNRGHIVMVGSFSAWHGNAGQSTYAAAKTGLAGLTTSLARELGPHNIRVNCVLPGFFPSRLTQSMTPEAMSRMREARCLDTPSTPEDVARFLACLHSLHAVSGQTFNLDSRIAPWT